MFSNFQIVFTLSKSMFSVVLSYTDLGSVKHQTRAEIAEAIKVCDEAMRTHNTKIASIAVDNAAKTVADGVSAHYLGDFHIVVVRDPSHCIDLLSKDLASCVRYWRMQRKCISL